MQTNTFFRCLQYCIGLIVITLFCAPNLTAGAPPPKIVLNTTGMVPLNSPSKTGFMDLVAAEAFARIGITLETVQLPAERGLKNADQGIEDGEMSRIAGLDEVYKNLLRVPEKIMDWSFVVFSKKPIKLSNGWQTLSNHYVAFLNGWKILEQNVPPDAKILKVRTAEQLFTMLDKNHTDVVIYEQWGGLQILKDRRSVDIHQLHPPLATREMYIYLHKKHAALVPTLSDALIQMKNDGTYQRYFNQVLSVLTNPP